MDLLPARLKAARKARGYTQAELASSAGMDQSHISRLENGGKGASLEHIQEIARALGVNVGYLVGEDITSISRGLESVTGNRAELVAAPDTPIGLRELAADAGLADALKITGLEWEALASVRLPVDASKDGYAQLLITIRAISGGH